MIRSQPAGRARVLSVGGPWDSREALEVPGGTQRSFRWTPRWAATSAPGFCPLAAGRWHTAGTVERVHTLSLMASEPRTHANTACPYCSVALNPPPKAKKRCPACGQPI